MPSSRESRRQTNVGDHGIWTMRPDRRVEGRQVLDSLDELHPPGPVEDPLNPLAHEQVIRGDDDAQRQSTHRCARDGGSRRHGVDPSRNPRTPMR